MTIQELQDKNLKQGIFHSAKWKSEKIVNGVKCEKVSKGVVRIVPYQNIGVVKAKASVSQTQATKQDNNQWIIKDLLSYNTKTGNYLVRFAKTSVRPQCEYKLNGVVVDKDQYETLVKPHTNDSPIFQVKLENLIDIK